MHFVVMGCGRVGSTLAVNLERRGHSVAIIDSDPLSFARLPEDFSGQQVTGIGFDRDVLRQAGIEDAHGFAAASSGDNSNIIAARVVRDTFGISNVVTRIYDPSRAQVYQKLGIESVAPVEWSADHMLRSLIPLGPYTEYLDAEFSVALLSVDLHEGWFGKTIETIESATGARVAYLVRYRKAQFPAPETIVQDGDSLRLLVPSERSSAVQRILNHAPSEDHL